MEQNQTVQVSKSQLDQLINERKQFIQQLNEVNTRDAKIFREVKKISDLLMNAKGEFDPSQVMGLIMNPKKLEAIGTQDFQDAFKFIMNFQEEKTIDTTQTAIEA